MHHEFKTYRKWLTKTSTAFTVHIKINNTGHKYTVNMYREFQGLNKVNA